MPTYEYACKACDHNFEIVQSFSEDTLTTCPACEQDALRKVYNAAGIIFKGEGWHVKDYASTPSSRSSSSDDSSSGTSEQASTDTSEKTPPTKKTEASSTTSSSGSGDGAAKPAAG